MLGSYHDLTPKKIAGLGFDDPAHAARLLQDLAGHDIPDAHFEELLPLLAQSLARSADPDRALANLAAWLASVGSRSLYYGLLREHPAALDAVLTVFAASQFFSDILIKNPEYFEVLANPTIRDRPRTSDDFFAEAERRIAIAKTPGARRDALRRFKPPEVLRIGARDILGIAQVPETIAEITGFAEACVRAAVKIAEAQEDFAVIGMGKLGGAELNYASDIDLIFVHADTMDEQEAIRLAEAVQETLSRRTDAGIVFRVDLRLRPEGRFGPISRSLGACRAYYESWAESWERQACLKARFIAGDPRLGEAFMRLITPFIYRHRVEERFIQDIRANKRQIERKVARAGQSETNVKEGVGAIRDVEFAVQLLQLVAGGANSGLRTGNTLAALDTLADISLLTLDERGVLRESYLFLRHVEHRLQIMDERPIRTIPTDEAALRKFGHSLGYESGDAFLAEYRRHTRQASTLFQELFYGKTGPRSLTPSPNNRGGGRGTGNAATPPPVIGGRMPEGQEGGQRAGQTLSDWVRTAEDASSKMALIDYLKNAGFADAEAAYGILRFSEVGSEYGAIPPEARERFAALAPRLLVSASATSSPDAALMGIDSLALAVPSRAALYLSFQEDEDLLERFCRLAAESPPLWQELLSHLEYLDMLSDVSQLEAPAPPLALPAKSPAKALAVFLRRERLRIGAADIWELATPAQVMEALTQKDQAAIGAALSLEPQTASQMAVIGMGKLGGGELNYVSDLDVLFVAADGADMAAANELAERTLALLRTEVARFGPSVEIDARLRPEGRFGPLVRTLTDYAAYYRKEAETWEKQALIKARPVAGDAEIGEKFVELARQIVYEHPPAPAQIEEMRHMKERIERERSAGEHDIKLGPGGLSDIEWIAQMLQWRHGKRWKKAQAPGTLASVAALRDAGVLRQDDWEALDETYLALAHWRNRRWLATGQAEDESLLEPEKLRKKRRQVRAIFTRLFLEEA